jgi:hypothetical protein
MNGLWRDPRGRSLTENDQDHVSFEWVPANAARTILDGRDPFFINWLGAPHGVNLMANTSMWTATLPLAPVTLLAGPGAALALPVRPVRLRRGAPVGFTAPAVPKRPLS